MHTTHSDWVPLFSTLFHDRGTQPSDTVRQHLHHGTHYTTRVVMSRLSLHHGFGQSLPTWCSSTSRSPFRCVRQRASYDALALHSIGFQGNLATSVDGLRCNNPLGPPRGVVGSFIGGVSHRDLATTCLHQRLHDAWPPDTHRVPFTKVTSRTPSTTAVHQLHHRWTPTLTHHRSDAHCANGHPSSVGDMHCVEHFTNNTSIPPVHPIPSEIWLRITGMFP